MKLPPRSLLKASDGPRRTNPTYPRAFAKHLLCDNTVVQLPNHTKRDPVFSITYALFAIHNFAYPLSFVNTAHSLAETPGVGYLSVPPIPNSPATPINSICYAEISLNNRRIHKLQEQPGGVRCPNFKFNPPAIM